MSGERRPLGRVVLLVNNFRVGGAELQALLLASWLQARGLRVTLMGLGETGPIEERAKTQGVPTVRLALPQAVRGGLPLNLLRLVLVLRGLRPDAVVGYTSASAMLACLARRWAGVPVAVWSQRDEGLFRAHPWLERCAVRRASGFVANGPSAARFLEHACAVDPGAIRCISNGIVVPQAIADRALARSRLGLPADAFVVASVANFRAPKDHRTLLEAWGHLAASQSAASRALLLLVGRDDGLERALRAQVETAGLVDCVRFMGCLEDVSPIHAAVDAVVLSSRSEGLPNSLLEGMAAGLPVVATDLPGTRACVGDGAGEWLVPAGNALALADRLGRLRSDAVLRETLGARNRQRIVESFSVDAMGRATLDLLLALWRGQFHTSRGVEIPS